MRKGQATRALVLDQAFNLASKVGFEGLTIGTLADLISVNRRLLEDIRFELRRHGDDRAKELSPRRYSADGEKS